MGKNETDHIHVVSSSFTRCINTERVIPFPLETISFTYTYTPSSSQYTHPPTHDIYIYIFIFIPSFVRFYVLSWKRAKKEKRRWEERMMVAWILHST